MDLGAIVDVAIGIVFVWIVLSLTTIQIQEWISMQLDKRAKDMEAAIHEMLANPNLKDQFYDHPLIRGLTAKKNRKEPSIIPAWFYRYPLLRGFTREKRRLPSYIPSQQFALALFDIVMTANTESSLIQQGLFRIRDDLQKESNLPLRKALIEELNLLVELARSAAATEAGTAITNKTIDTLRKETGEFIERFRAKHPEIKLDDEMILKLTMGIDNALQQAVKLKAEMDHVVSQQPKNDMDTALSKVRRGVAALSVISPEVHQSLNSLLMNVEEYAGEKEKLLAKARSNVENWFNDSMDRVSGVYKRYSQNLALIIGIIVALVLNVDSINLTLYLWRDPAVRQVLAEQASKFELPKEQFEANPQQAMQDIRNQFAGLNLPVGWGINQVASGRAYGNDSCQMFPAKKQEPEQKQVFGIPIFGSDKCLTPPQSDDQTNLILKTLGILITALAARQGAPFWFDMLKRVVNLRSTGANPVEKK